MDLHQLDWNSAGVKSGREKIDLLVPVATETLGTIIVKLSGEYKN